MPEQIPDLFNYRSARQYLLDFVACKQRHDRNFTLRSWSREMGMATHSLLIMVLNGKRRISLKQLPLFAKGLKLNPQEQLYFQTMVQYENAGTEEERQTYELWFSQHAPSDQNSKREIDQYWMISDWIHMAILEIMNLKGFDGSIHFLRKKLSNQYSSQEIMAAVRRLKNFKLIEEKDEKIARAWGHVTTKDDMPNLGVREYHRQVSDLAKIAVIEQPVQEREFHGFAISVAKDDLLIAKNMIREFRAQLCKVLSARPGDEVYQMNMQFFRLTGEDEVNAEAEVERLSS